MRCPKCNSNNFDVICFQETKMDESLADPEYFKKLGYNSHWHCAVKKGYSGVLTLTKEKPKKKVCSANWLLKYLWDK